MHTLTTVSFSPLFISYSSLDSLSTMDIFNSFTATERPNVLLCVGMHTTGEPTRIVVKGIDHLLTGERLLDKRDSAKREHDHLRKR